jgi:hypothetical protein
MQGTKTARANRPSTPSKLANNLLAWIVMIANQTQVVNPGHITHSLTQSNKHHPAPYSFSVFTYLDLFGFLDIFLLLNSGFS